MRVPVRSHLRVLSVAVAVAVLALMPTEATAQDARQSRCSGPEYRQFDFWAGDWEVRTPDGNLAGTNTITPMLNGCVLHEQWAGARGSVGESFNIYDRRSGTWHQTWVDNGGLLLRLDGQLEDGSVRQLWETSTDGESWNTAFDGTYRPKAASD